MSATQQSLRIGHTGGKFPPGPPFLPRLLSGRAFRQNGAEFMLDCARTHGDLVYYWAFGKHIFQLNHPDLVEDFFLKDAHRHTRGLVMQRARAVLGHGLLTSEEPLHMRQRRLAQPAFHRDRIAGYAQVIGDQATAMTDRWSSGSVMDLRREMLAIALRIVGQCLFGLRVDSEDEVRTISAAVDAFMGFLPLAFLPFHQLLLRSPLPGMRRIRDGAARLDGLIYGMIDERRAALARGESADSGDLLAMLMAATDPEATGAAVGQTMTDTQLRDECITILLAGHETTANALSFALGVAARMPEWQTLLRQEAREVLGDRVPTAADFARLPRTTAFFSEVMRLYPPVWATARTCEQPYKIAGYTIPRGAVLLAPQFVVQRDPRFFSDPERFDPSRFDPSRFDPEARAARPRFAYFPFAAGSRQCIGEGLAWMEGVFVLATILRDWRLSLPAGEPEAIPFTPSISLRPTNPVRVQVDRAD